MYLVDFFRFVFDLNGVKGLIGAIFFIIACVCYIALGLSLIILFLEYMGFWFIVPVSFLIFLIVFEIIGKLTS